MGFWAFMFVVDLVMPIIMIIFGRLFMTRPPEEINRFYGYRTAMSMKNNETWAFAHNYCGRIWFWSGLVVMPLSIISLLIVIKKSIAMIGIVGGAVCVIQVVPMIISIILTEIALRKTFDKNGNRKTN